MKSWSDMQNFLSEKYGGLIEPFSNKKDSNKLFKILLLALIMIFLICEMEL